MSSEVDGFVGRAIAERAASVLVAGPVEGAGLLRGWVEALCAAHSLHVVAIVGDQGPWGGGPRGRSLVSVLVCDAERSADAALRSALRQDPDVIVCERETSPSTEFLLQAAATGHQVLAHVPGGLEEVEAAAPFGPLGELIHLGVEADAEGIARLIRFAGAERPREVLWARGQTQDLPAELPGRAPPPPPPPVPAPEPLSAAVVEAARAGLAPLLRPSWTPLLAEPSGDAACSKLGGLPMLAPGEAWPTCPSCALALPLALQLRCDALPSGAAINAPPGAGWLQLFYCDSPGCDCEDLADPAGRNRVLRWLPLAGAAPAVAQPDPLGDEAQRSWTPADVRGWEQRREAPHPEDLDGLDAKTREACEALREQRYAREAARQSGTALPPELLDDAELDALAGARAGDKLLGWPAWEQGAEWIDCPQCGARCRVLVQLDAWRGQLTALFAADGLGHVSACPAHPEVLAFAWACG